MIFRKPKPEKPLAPVDGAVRASMYRLDALIVDLFDQGLDAHDRAHKESLYGQNLRLLERLGNERAHEVYAGLYATYERRVAVWRDTPHA